jgi:hypothetical protein
VWNVLSGQMLYSIDDLRFGCLAMAFSSDAMWLATAGPEGAVLVSSHPVCFPRGTRDRQLIVFAEREA